MLVCCLKAAQSLNIKKVEKEPENCNIVLFYYPIFTCWDKCEQHLLCYSAPGFVNSCLIVGHIDSFDILFSLCLVPLCFGQTVVVCLQMCLIKNVFQDQATAEPNISVSQ